MTESEGEAIRYHRLTVIGDAGRNKWGYLLWRVRCDCGTEKISLMSHVKHGRTKSCGCLQREKAGAINRTHGMSGTKTHSIWRSMLQRCRNPKAEKYRYYGGRGIKVCERWQGFEMFYEDMGECPDGLTLERENVDGDYCLENCRWATWQEQNRNSGNNRLLTFDGETHPVCVWAEKVNLPRQSIFNRLWLGWSVERTLTTPPLRCRKVAS